MTRYCAVVLLFLPLLAPHGSLCKEPCREMRQTQGAAVCEFTAIPAECCVAIDQPRLATVLKSAPELAGPAAAIEPGVFSPLLLADSKRRSRRSTVAPHPLDARQRLSLLSFLRI